MKWVGLFVIALVGLTTIKDLWDLLGDLRLSMVRGEGGRGGGGEGRGGEGEGRGICWGRVGGGEGGGEEGRELD